MASIFTFDPNPPRVSSPWVETVARDDIPGDNDQEASLSKSQSGHGTLADYSFTKLQAEPQSGPTEYKLHLLLRSRRQYTYMSTAEGTQQYPHSRDVPFNPKPSPTVSGALHQTRQQRLQHLTTQLLWRLQQSSPYHASSSKDINIPKLPDDSIDLSHPVQPKKLLPGLEESRGALYEIGVSDDGTLVGLTEDEMSDSLNTLRIMAASLGCLVDVVRMIIVGNCEWVEVTEPVDMSTSPPSQVVRSCNLWVAEALVTPNLGWHRDANSHEKETLDMDEDDLARQQRMIMPSRGSSSTLQLRVTLTGPTTSGKSSLLGTLSTGTLDNGRGKSRLNLLKHRHEMVSGVTSSVAQELIGYRNEEIMNFSRGNIESWVDIHDRSEGGRLAFISDSGGHPRYRRTVLRGLMNWSPHWSILCVAANSADDSSCGAEASFPSHDSLEAGSSGIDLVDAHLTLSLKLNVPMAVVVTKLDMASKSSLQKTMIKILAAIKDAGRTPKILQPDQKQHDILTHIPSEDLTKAQAAVESIIQAENLSSVVPIVLTSVVKGTGVGLVHALLANLPLPAPPTASDFIGKALNPEQPKALFHVDDTFNFTVPHGVCNTMGLDHPNDGRGIITSGYVRFGTLSVGDRIVVGPFPSGEDCWRILGSRYPSSPGGYGLSISHPASADLAKVAIKNAVPASGTTGEWHEARIISIRNLRLPVRALEPGQAGSIGMVFSCKTNSSDISPSISGLRRGMVLAVPSKHMDDTGLSLQAASGFTAQFSGSESSPVVGSLVNVYLASVRAAARVLHVSTRQDDNEVDDGEDDVFGFQDNLETPPLVCEIALELLHNREWIELGSCVILLEGGRTDKSGLEGLVGKVIEVVD